MNQVTSIDPDAVWTGKFRRRLGKVSMATIGFTQTGRVLQIETPLGQDVLLLRSVSGHEAISQLFRFQLDLLSEIDDSIAFESIVGQNVTIHLQTLDAYRGFNGFISRFSQGSSDGRFTYYRAEMVPWLWFLTRKADCRIFQKQSVPDIIQTIFSDLGFTDFELRLYGNFRKRDYCVQYRETDFNFVSRLLEEEGIYYFFEHHTDSSDSEQGSQSTAGKGGKHTLVLTNDPAGHKPCPKQPKARCDFNVGGTRPEDLISDWRVEEEYRPSAWAHTDYNFETPSTSLMATVKDEGTYEIYDYPGFYANKGDGSQLAKTRLQETLAFKKRVSGKSTCRSFTTGATLEVTDHYRKDMNQKWMLTAVYHQCTMGDAYGSGGSDEGFYYTNSFECIPADVTFRPVRVTPKPSMQGCQTAVVVGPAGEEIYTEKYGRVKVQFHWDRIGKNDENSSCWIRVSHPWAGKGWGGVSIPRIGQEVIVDFLEGDPDQPIIVGRVYHAENMPPYPLPSGAVVSGLKSNSTKGGGGYNEISMNDTKGNEMVTVHAQYDMSSTVEHDDTQTVHNNRTITVDGTHSETVTGAVTETYKNNQTTSVDGTNTETVKGAMTENYKANQTTTVNNEIVITSQTSSVHITASTEVQLLVGASKLLMKTNGDIELSGVNVSIKGSSTVTVKGGIVHSEADSEHQTKGAIVLSDGSATNTVKGGMVMLNP
jgi:type VI secretion system secreted protein VgrG